MKKKVLVGYLLPLFLVLSFFSVNMVSAAPPLIDRPMEFVSATLEGNGPKTVDPAASYDTASAELIMNVYETLLSFDGERMDRYVPQIAQSWQIQELIPPTQDGATGLYWYYRYTFTIGKSILWHDLELVQLKPEDVEYSFERVMVMDMGPAWTLYEPMLDSVGATYINGVACDPEGNIAHRVLVGTMIDHAVESNDTHVWFNLAFPGAYAPFMQILAQTWCSTLSKQWCNSLGRANWDGNWGDYTDWWTYHNPSLPPLDNPTPVACGSGPFMLESLDDGLGVWSANRFVNYWRGWGSGPAPNYGIGWPAFGLSKPAGYIDHIVVTWSDDWTARSTKFLNGEVDFCAVPRQYISQMLGQPGIRCHWPLPPLSIEAMFFTFQINPTSPYGSILPPDTFSETGIPSNFFSYMAVRKAFAQLIDYNTYISTAYLNEAMQPATAIPQPVTYYDPSIPKYTFNLSAAATLLQSVPGLWDSGFTITMCYVEGNLAQQTLCEQLRNAIMGLGPRFMVNVVAIQWASFLYARDNRLLPAYVQGWLADYPDPHNYAYSFYQTYGYFPTRQAYSDPTMDALIEAGIRIPNGPERQAIYSDIQQLAIDDCPSVALAWVAGRHFERTWICGWYYNAVYGGSLVSGISSTAPESTALYFANLWKYYYTPHAQQDTIPANSTGNLLPYDVNYDGKTNMVDIGMTAWAFGAIYGPPMSASWVYRCDFNNDRKIDMKDIGGAARNFGALIKPWDPMP